MYPDPVCSAFVMKKEYERSGQVRMLTVGVSIDELVNDPLSEEGTKHSVEFCGGTHVKNSKDIGDFALVSEEAIAKGIRRVVCLTGKHAEKVWL